MAVAVAVVVLVMPVFAVMLLPWLGVLGTAEEPPVLALTVREVVVGIAWLLDDVLLPVVKRVRRTLVFVVVVVVVALGWPPWLLLLLLLDDAPPLVDMLGPDGMGICILLLLLLLEGCFGAC